MHYHDSQNSRFSPDNLLFGGELTLQYLIDRGTTSYSRLSRGFRGAGFNVNPEIPADRKRYDPETLTNLEFGIRMERADGRASFNSTIFGYRRNDQQLGLSLQNDPSDPLGIP